MLIIYGVNLINFENLSTTVKTASYPGVVVGSDTIRSIITCSKGSLAGGSGYNNPPST